MPNKVTLRSETTVPLTHEEMDRNLITSFDYGTSDVVPIKTLP